MFSDLIKKYMNDEAVDELIVDGRGAVWLAYGNRFEAAQRYDHGDFLDELHLFATEQKLRLDQTKPFAGGRMGEFRWHVVIAPMSPIPTLSIRRHRFKSLDPKRFAAEPLAQARDSFESSRPLVICGPTGSGKSSMMMAILQEYCLQERLCIIEEYDELPALSSLWQKLLGSDTHKLFKESLRLRPQRYVIGEIRGLEAAVFHEAMMTGHLAPVATMHAGSKEEARRRIQMYADFSEGELGRVNLVTLPNQN